MTLASSPRASIRIEDRVANISSEPKGYAIFIQDALFPLVWAPGDSDCVSRERSGLCAHCSALFDSEVAGSRHAMPCSVLISAQLRECSGELCSIWGHLQPLNTPCPSKRITNRESHNVLPELWCTRLLKLIFYFSKALHVVDRGRVC